MITDSDIPHDFKISLFPNYVRIATANVIIGAQYVERVLNAICLILQTKGLLFSNEDFMSGDSARTRQTLGMIEKQLRKTRLFDSSFSSRIVNFTRRRNRVVHGLFADIFKSDNDIDFESPIAQNYIKECEWCAMEGAELVEVGFGIYRTLGNILLRSKPDDPELVGLMNKFDEFQKIDINAFSPNYRPYFKSTKPYDEK